MSPQFLQVLVLFERGLNRDRAKTGRDPSGGSLPPFPGPGVPRSTRALRGVCPARLVSQTLRFHLLLFLVFCAPFQRASRFHCFPLVPTSSRKQKASNSAICLRHWRGNTKCQIESGKRKGERSKPNVCAAAPGRDSTTKHDMF